MIVTILQAAIAVIGIITLLLQRPKDVNNDANIQSERKALQDNDGSIDAIAADQHDRVQQAFCSGERRGSGNGEKVNH